MKICLHILTDKPMLWTPQLQAQVVRLKDELEREREERNYFQVERDKINTFWEIGKRQLDESKAELRNKDREIEEVEERHAVEIKVQRLLPQTTSGRWSLRRSLRACY